MTRYFSDFLPTHSKHNGKEETWTFFLIKKKKKINQVLRLKTEKVGKTSLQRTSILILYFSAFLSKYTLK